jgi:hypothetical protein
MNIKTHDSYEVSKRVTLRRGDMFRATAGPYWKGSDGKKHSMKARGPYKFVSYQTQGRRRWLVVWDRDGGFSVLPLYKSSKTIDGRYVARPYRITSRIKPKKGAKA